MSTHSRDKSAHYFSKKRSAMMLDESIDTMQGTFSQNGTKSVKNSRLLLEKIERRRHHLLPVDHEMSHKIFRSPMPPIGCAMSGSSDNEVEVNMKHIDAVRSRLLEE